MKFITQLDVDVPVWLAIAPEHRGRASLIYDSSRLRRNPGDVEWRFPLDVGSSAVRFEACHERGGYTQYNGGMLVDGYGCVNLEIYVEDVGRPPLLHQARFATGSC